MVKLWMRWCRLCAREDHSNTHINVFLKDEEGLMLSETINKLFLTEFNQLNDWPKMICLQCFYLVESVIQLTHKAQSATAMFTKLFEDTADILDAKQIRQHFGIDFELVPTALADINFESLPNMPPTKTIEPMIHADEFEDNNLLNPITIKTEKDDEAHQDDESLSKYSSPDSSTEDSDYMAEIPKKRAYTLTKKRKAEIDAKPHKCLECKKGFKKLEFYRRHMKREHEVIIDQKPLSTVCEECGKVCKSIYALKEHQIAHTNERTVKCKRCNKLFKNKAGLKRHEDTHAETIYICVVCGLQLNTRRTLTLHMVCHSDQKQHKCSYCGNEYKRAKSLKTHLISHTGLKPYSCNFCDKAFSNGANCRSHKKKHHPKELAELDAAGQNNTIAVIPKLKDLRAVLAKAAGKSEIVSTSNSVQDSPLLTAENKYGAERHSCNEEDRSKHISSTTEDTVNQQTNTFLHGIFGTIESRL